MASRSFKPTPAFRKKEQQVRQSVADKTKEKLQRDMENLFNDAQYSDLVMLVGSRQLAVHSFILKARFPELYDYCQNHAEDKEVSISAMPYEELQKCMNSLYSKDNFDRVNLEKALSLNGSQNSTSQGASLLADLLKLVDDNTGDIQFVIESKVVKAHRAILISRCDYFAAMFSSSWRETSSPNITIHDVSYEVFVAALKFLYGVSQDILAMKPMKVLQFADMYGMEELQSLVTGNLKITKCHLFHKPCTFCIPQVYECLKLCEVFFQLQDFKLQCIQWVSKYYEKTLACKEFNLIPETFQNEVKTEIEKQINHSKALEVWGKCVVLVRSLTGSSHNKWARVVQDFVTKIQASCVTVAIEHFVSICNSFILPEFLKEINYSSLLLEQFLDAVNDMLTIENCCNVLRGLLVLIQIGKEPSFSDPFDSDTFAIVEKSCKRCEKFIVGRIGQVTKTKAWKSITASKQKELKEAAFFVDI